MRRIAQVVPWICVAVVLSMAGGTPAWGEQVTGLRAWHRAGQTFLTWHEVINPMRQEKISVQELKKISAEIEQEQRLRYRIYRSSQPITSVKGLKPIAEVMPFSGWNFDYYGISPKPEDWAFRYVVEDGKEQVSRGTGIYVYNPRQADKAFYAVTAAINGIEDTSGSASNALQTAVEEIVGTGLPVLQRIARPNSFQFVSEPTLHYYVRWETHPNTNIPGKPFDYLVAIPPKLPKPAAIGLHLHAWGGSLNNDFAWWFNAEKGAILVSSNQIPYDWWTGYHELLGTGKQLKTQEDWKSGVVRPYTQRRLLAFLDWVATKWEIDLNQTFVAGNSMGGSGALMLALRYPPRIAWAVSWVGVHVPSNSPQFKSSYEAVYGARDWGVKFEDGTTVWDYFNDAWYLRRYPERDVGFVTFSNGKNDGGIGWQQAVDFYRALQEARQPHVFVWGKQGHNQRAYMPKGGGERVMPIDIRTNQSLPAFTNCSLDDNPGSGDPGNGDASGQVNLYLFWETDDIVDTPDRWEMTIGLLDGATKDPVTVDITPRRRQHFKTKPGERVAWTNLSLSSKSVIQSGQVAADRSGLVTLKDVFVHKNNNRISIKRRDQPDN